MRRSGILLPIFSLHGNYGAGTLGKPAYEFADFLSCSGQHYWQILPLNPTSYGNSPYQSPSVFAFNHYFIDPDFLVRDGLLSKKEVLSHQRENCFKVDYGDLYKTRLSLLKAAAENISDADSDFIKFSQENSFWLSDYGAFMTLKEENRMLPFSVWTVKGSDIKDAHKKSMLHCKIQFLFYTQWLALKKYANAKGVHIIGDLPIYPSADSSDYYFSKDNFQQGVVAACPPDSFSPNGQLWGNPVYDWDKMESESFSWWKARLSQAQMLYDAVRIDHFRGIYEYYAVNENDTTAINGRWHKGPGIKLVNMIRESFPGLDIIAEDLGFLTDDAKAFFLQSGFPGMKVLQFAFDGDDSEYLPHNYSRNSVCYTGTHDNPTTLQWICTSSQKQLTTAIDYLGAASATCLCDAFIRGALSSVCDTAIIPFQDWLHLGCTGRINTPGTTGDNWIYRINSHDLSHKLSEKILYYTKLYKRAKE